MAKKSLKNDKIEIVRVEKITVLYFKQNTSFAIKQLNNCRSICLLRLSDILRKIR